MSSDASPVWFITGCSTGFGREIAKTVLARGGRAVVTARDASSVADLTAGAEDRALALALDVTKRQDIEAAVQAALARFGAMDVLVNNAGYGYQATIEEGLDAEIRAQFEANVFGLFAVTRAVLPEMRARKRGHVINISSVAGLVGFPGSGYYAASKHAVEGMSDALAAEVAPFGVRVTCVEPGPFRTDWAGRSLKQTRTEIADYAQTAGTRLKFAVASSGKQPGDPARAAGIIADIALSASAPRHLVLGAFGADAVAGRLRARLEEVERWREISVSADFPAP